ncbi:MAG TPA: hypothetical protein VNO30_12900 [Kofleriaceae bacterium]|nr:hypothetical protein [Kofleriaceae bacterium]
MTFRSDLDALRARHDALEREVSTRQQELAETRRMIDDVERRARLPVLDNLRVAAPCAADWSKMEGDERVRACGDCSQYVYNLSGMTREEAEALILEKEGRLCVRYYRRADGTILFGDCAVGVSRRRRRKLVAGAAALLAATGAVAYRATASQVLGGVSVDVRPRAELEMGRVADTPPPPPPPPPRAE